MKEHFVIDPLISKRQQLLLATQLCRMVLKVRFPYLPFRCVRYRTAHRPVGVGCHPLPTLPSDPIPSRSVYPGLRFPALPASPKSSREGGYGEAGKRMHFTSYT